LKTAISLKPEVQASNRRTAAPDLYKIKRMWEKKSAKERNCKKLEGKKVIS